MTDWSWRDQPPSDQQVRLVSRLRSVLRLPDVRLANKQEAGHEIQWLKQKIKESRA